MKTKIFKREKVEAKRNPALFQQTQKATTSTNQN
jgi:hypothetical protein